MKNSRNVLITGATKGIGLATAKFLADKGFKVYGTARKNSDSSGLDAAVGESGGRLHKAILDVVDCPSIHRVVDEIIHADGRIDILINNACDVVFGTAESCTLEQQIRSMDVNYFGVVRMLKTVLPHMRQRKSGHVINLSSVAGIDPYPPLETYAATKFALEGLTESLATNLRPWGIWLTLIEPGGVKTTIPQTAAQGKEVLKGDPYRVYSEQSQKIMSESYQRIAQAPEEIAETIWSALESPRPHLRYQCGTFANEVARRRFQDPTGDALVVDKQKRLEAMGLYSLLKP